MRINRHLTVSKLRCTRVGSLGYSFNIANYENTQNPK